jgi:formylglycine-generating enzyme required for sulfatase activity
MFQQGSNLALGGGPNWVLVPGNGAFGTPNFYVMQYDAGCSDGNGNPVNTPLDSNGGGYNWGVTPCTGKVASIPNAAPIVDISHTNAITACASIGAHLLTNDEYMTIVTNAAGQGMNWSNGSVGSGVMPRGNSNSSAVMWSGGSQYGTGYSDFTHLRTMTLSNGSVIWDMAGNVWEHVQRSNNNSGDNQSTITTPTCNTGTPGSGEWCEFNNYNSKTPYITGYNDSSFSAATVGPPQTWNSTQNIGQVHGNDGSTYGQVFLRGGRWDNGPAAGPFTLDLAWGTTYTSSDVGFRCAR